MTGFAKNKTVVNPRKTRFAQNMTLLASTLTVYVTNRKTFSPEKTVFAQNRTVFASNMNLFGPIIIIFIIHMD